MVCSRQATRGEGALRGPGHIQGTLTNSSQVVMTGRMKTLTASHLCSTGAWGPPTLCPWVPPHMLRSYLQAEAPESCPSSPSRASPPAWDLPHFCTLGFFFFFFFSFCFRATPVAYGGSQARGQIGAVANSLHHSHSNTRSKLRL